jgi:uncharacterized protein YbgA (DUF1722 family)
MKYYVIYAQKKRGNYLILLNLNDAKLYQTRRLLNYNQNIIELDSEEKLGRVVSSSIDRYLFKAGFSTFFNDPLIINKLLHKVNTSRYVTPRVHLISYLKEVIKLKERKALIDLIQKKEEITINIMNPHFKKTELFLIDSYLLNKPCELLIKFYFPLEL